MFSLPIILLIACPAFAIELSLKKCPPFNPPSQQFEINNYLGTWYEIARSKVIFEAGLDCVNATYTLEKDGSISILNQGYDIAKKKRFSQTGTGRTTSQSNLLYVNLFPLIPDVPYYITDTDLIKKGASVVISCYDTPLFSLRAGYILSRKAVVDDLEKQLLADILISYGFDAKTVYFTEQAKCPK